ncbi:MAG TPA: hypothetical protein VFE98_01700 [Candidatus Bathyarchaeia archaeon]|nr:hypothetical protein [Candidatus Bathyarchaeia archaeon]
MSSTLFVGTNLLFLGQDPTVHRTQALSQSPPLNANASLPAFGYTIGQGDLFTNQTNFVATPTSAPPGAKAKWFSVLSHTSSGIPIPGTSLNYNVTANSAKGKQQYNWTLPNIPKSNICQNCDSTVRFTFAGNLNKGTSANYTLTFANNITIISHAEHVANSTFPGPAVSLSCPQLNVCVNVTRYTGFTLRLSLNFGWNAGNAGMTVTVGEILVAAIGNQIVPSVANWMSINGTDPTRVNHTARLLVPLMNNTVQYSNGTSTLTHRWKNEVLNLYYPAGYQSLRVNLNASVSPFFPASGRSPFESTPCNDPPTCTRSLLGLNMSDVFPVLRNTSVIIRANSLNTLHPTTASSLVNTAFGTVPLRYFVPGDNMTMKVTNLPSAVNATIQQANPKLNITFTDTNGSNQTIPPSTFTTTTRGGLFGFTVPSSPLGVWRYNVTYVSSYDLGTAAGAFTVDQMIVAPNSFAYSANGNQLSVTGKLLNSSRLLPSAANGTVFAVDTSSGSSPFTPSANNPSQGLYFSNVTMANGLFTSGQTLTLFFTMVNPTAPQPLNASLTIDHEWSKGLVHGVTATIPFTLGDQPFTLGQYTYQLDATLLPNGIQAKLTSLLTGRSTTVTLSNSTSPVVTTRQQTGMFKFSITSTFVNGTGLHVNSIESPPYAYVLSGPTTGRYLAHSDTFTTASDGSFSASLPANMTVGARKLVLFALARDSKGIVLWNRNQDPTSAMDSTALNSSVDRIGEVTVRQSVSATLHVTNNSTKISQSITVDLNLQGPGIQGSTKLGSQSVSLGPGESKTLTYQFAAPSQPGTYTLTFSSPQYGRPLVTQTLQVVLVQGLIQLLFPLIIGVVAAIVVLGYYLVRKRPVPAAVAKPAGQKPPRTKSNIISPNV